MEDKCEICYDKSTQLLAKIYYRIRFGIMTLEIIEPFLGR